MLSFSESFCSSDVRVVYIDPFLPKSALQYNRSNQKTSTEYFFYKKILLFYHISGIDCDCISTGRCVNSKATEKSGKIRSGRKVSPFFTIKFDKTFFWLYVYNVKPSERSQFLFCKQIIMTF